GVRVRGAKAQVVTQPHSTAAHPVIPDAQEEVAVHGGVVRHQNALCLFKEVLDLQGAGSATAEAVADYLDLLHFPPEPDAPLAVEKKIVADANTMDRQSGAVCLPLALNTQQGDPGKALVELAVPNHDGWPCRALDRRDVFNLDA